MTVEANKRPFKKIRVNFLNGFGPPGPSPLVSICVIFQKNLPPFEHVFFEWSLRDSSEKIQVEAPTKTKGKIVKKCYFT
jgi:hypothetical protein